MTKNENVKPTGTVENEISTSVATPSDTGYPMSVLVREDENYRVFQQPDGKFVRKLKFKPLMTVKTESTEEKLNLLKLRETAIEMKNIIGQEIEIEGVIIEPFDRINEETGEEEHGATTTLITEGFSKLVVTSSSTVYMKIMEWYSLFGAEMFTEGSLLTVKPQRQKGREYELTTLVLV